MSASPLNYSISEDYLRAKSNRAARWAAEEQEKALRRAQERLKDKQASSNDDGAINGATALLIHAHLNHNSNTSASLDDNCDASSDNSSACDSGSSDSGGGGSD